MAAIASAPLKRRFWDIPPLYFVVAIALMMALHWLLPLAQVIAWPWSLAGSVLLVAGVVLAVAAERRFKREGTAVRPLEPSTALVEDGPFRSAATRCIPAWSWRSWGSSSCSGA